MRLIVAIALVFIATACGGSSELKAEGPGGTIIATRGGDFRLYRIDPESGSAVLLALDRDARSPGAHDSEPACAPNGRQIAFVRDSIGETELRLHDLGTEESRLLRRLRIGFASPAWAPDGRVLAYADSIGGLRLVEVETGQLTVLTRGFDEHPTWSPNGERVAYERDRTGNGQTSIWTMDTEGKDRRQLTHPSGLDADHNPMWSPHGELIAFERPYDVWVIDSATGATRRVAKLAELRSWSPDGQSVLVHELRRDLAKTGLYAVPVEGTGQPRFIAPGFWVEACWLD